MVPTGDGPTQVERSESGIIRHPSTVYGASQGGNALNVWLPDNEKPAILVMAAMHGDEPETTVVLSEALRAIRRGSLKNAVILSANPDGLCLGTRGNANGVDLNRNFPASNWAPEILFYKSRKAGPRDIAISPGARPASEPETQALLRLIDDLQPLAVITLHAGSQGSWITWKTWPS